MSGWDHALHCPFERRSIFPDTLAGSLAEGLESRGCRLYEEYRLTDALQVDAKRRFDLSLSLMRMQNQQMASEMARGGS